MFVMHEPMKTSSIASPCTVESLRASSGSLGAQRTGSVISARSISIVAAYSASVALEQLGAAIQFSMHAMRRSSVRASP